MQFGLVASTIWTLEVEVQTFNELTPLVANIIVPFLLDEGNCLYWLKIHWDLFQLHCIPASLFICSVYSFSIPEFSRQFNMPCTPTSDSFISVLHIEMHKLQILTRQPVHGHQGLVSSAHEPCPPCLTHSAFLCWLVLCDCITVIDKVTPDSLVWHSRLAMIWSHLLFQPFPCSQPHTYAQYSPFLELPRLSLPGIGSLFLPLGRLCPTAVLFPSIL